MQEYILMLLISIVANMVSHIVCKWLDGDF